MIYQSLSEAFRTFRGRLPERARLYVGGCSGDPLALADVIRAAPDLAGGVTFLGVWIPGINRTDWAALSPGAWAETIFLAPDYRAGFEAGRTRFLPIPYTQAWPWLCETPLDGSVVMVSPPDGSGEVSLGVSPDFAPAVLARGEVPVLGIINPHMPAARDSVRVPLSRFAMLAEDARPLVEVAPAALPPAFEAIARHIAGMIEAGDTLQFGLGNVQQAVLTELAGRRGLRIHSGMVSDPVRGLMDGDPDIDITTGIAVGSAALYARLASAKNVRFRPVIETHSLSVLAAIPRFTAINSLIEIDLFGQANAEFMGGRQVSGLGGLVDFLRGAGLSPGGRGITALASTAKGGAVSRIVARLAPGATSIARTDLDIVVTEHGAARLKGRDIDARAEALIGIADPAHRARLSDEWSRIRSRM
ncbi:acetyl-CoA hydrolase/transferase family protein [Hyphomonas sp.]|uniref:acetyl-CoA hydrolase/transferase family protein n=1 Tax=Hyphomonas sp. TaxID=87 RepID=UPI00391C5238